MRRECDPEELIDCWTSSTTTDWALVANKSGPTRLGFAVLLKFFALEGRFPRHAGEVPKPALDYLAGQLRVPSELSSTTTGRVGRSSITGPRSARLAFGRPLWATRRSWPDGSPPQVCPLELSEERRRDALVARCRAQRIEPPALSRCDHLQDHLQTGRQQEHRRASPNGKAGDIGAANRLVV